MVAATEGKQDKEKKLTLLGHLQEIRRRLVYCTIALIVTVAASFFLTDRIIKFLESYVPEGTSITFIEVTEMFGVWFKVCLYSALVMALPFFILQLVLFIRPALTRKERAYLYLLLPAVLLCFLGGAAFAWYVFLPHALEFLLGFGKELVDEPQIRISNLISFEVQIIFWMGIVFELPVVTFFLAKIGILNYRWLVKQWKWAFIGSFVLGAVITPTPDPINCTIVSVPIFLLYLLSIVTAWIARPGRKATAQ
jgi:sec-independent protein translocase protein TatC